MNPLLNRLLGGKERQNVQQPQTLETIDSLQLHQRVSIVGWIANKLGQLIGVESCNNGRLLIEALNKELTNLNLDKQEDYLLYLADQLVSWIENGDDVYFNIQMLELEAKYHRNLLEVYEIIKTDESIYFNKKNFEAKEICLEEEIWRIYRDVMHAASQRKFLLIKEEELESYKSGQVLCVEPVLEKQDIPKARNKAKEVLQCLGLSQSKISSYILLISEGITNVLKHARDGRLLLVQTKQSLNVIIEDKGPGFPLKILPYTVLTEGYSTKKSLGQGFTLMLKLANKVLLKTSKEGSTVVLVFENEAGENDGFE